MKFFVTNPRKQLVFYTIFTISSLLLPLMASSHTTTFDFPSFPLQNFTLLGDSYLRNGVAGLTIESGVPSSSAGAIIYSTPVFFSDHRTNSTVSFSTRFSFSVVNMNPKSSTGDGLSFFLSPENHTLGSPGGYLGLVSSSQLTKNKFIAIEFDTRLDSHFNDPNDNHVGLDIESLNSIKTADCMAAGIDLKTGISFTAWIDYSNDQNNLKVFLSNSRFKPDIPLLNVDTYLSNYFHEFMYLGFSGSTQGTTETHLIENWSFKSFGIKHMNPRINNPHNVADNSLLQNQNRHKHHEKIQLWLKFSSPVIFFAVLVIFAFISVKKWRSMNTDMNIKAELTSTPRQFTYRELKIATNNFHSSRIIGHGSFGTVYKAFLLSSGTTAAVKRSLHAHEGQTEFLAELTTIACLRHKNLVQLLGWCVEKGELLLVYELMPYGSMDKVLYQDRDHYGFLKWSHRYNIAMGLASVLTYLHEECDQQVIHRDIKASNIMLDANFNARLGDFGLAILMDHNKSPVSTLTAGTIGYLAPEYLHCGKVNEKTDVFSYGVVVLEICCGRKPIEREIGGQNGNTVNLVDWVWGLYAKGDIFDAIDKRLNGEFDEVEGRRLLMVGLSCANPDSEMRPTMRHVLRILNLEGEEMVVPKVKPMVNFSVSLPLNVEDLVSWSGDVDDEYDERIGSCKTSESGVEIGIDFNN